MKISLKEIIIYVAFLLISIGLNFYQLFRPDTIEERIVKEYIIKTDTVVAIEKDFDTVYIKKTIYKDNYIYDTVHVNDVVYVRDTSIQHDFRTPDYDLSVNAVKLDWYKLNIHARDTITVEHHNTVETIVKKEKLKPQLGVYAGIGYEFNNKTFNPQIGVGITIPLTKW